VSRPEGHFAAFDTQVWGTGQDQCATIKRNLCLLLPGASVFLDVDDLKSIDALEEYIDQSQVGFERSALAGRWLLRALTMRVARPRAGTGARG